MQCNVPVCQKMLDWAVLHARGAPGVSNKDLLEPFCGNGNFTLPLSRLFQNTLATELDPVAVNALRVCATMVGADSVKAEVLSCAQTLAGLRAGRYDNFNFSTVLVNPPREGVEPGMLRYAQGLGTIMYVSCNPATLLRDTTKLMKTHRVAAAAMFDQFPFSEHAEVGLVLRKLGSNTV
jgi:tRNA (uracil-5-)-methyltransferase